MESDRVRFKPELGTGSNYEHRLKRKRLSGMIDAKLWKIKVFKFTLERWKIKSRYKRKWGCLKFTMSDVPWLDRPESCLMSFTAADYLSLNELIRWIIFAETTKLANRSIRYELYNSWNKEEITNILQFLETINLKMDFVIILKLIQVKIK